MQWYIIKNLSEYDIELRFEKGVSRLVKPGKISFWYGEAENFAELQQALEEGLVDVWLTEPYRKVNWAKEGF